MAKLESRIQELERRHLRREFDSLETVPTVEEARKIIEITASADKEINRRAAWNGVRSHSGWEKTAAGARYRGARGIAYLEGQDEAFVVRGTSQKPQFFASLTAAVSVAEQIGGLVAAAEEEEEDERSEEEEAPEAPVAEYTPESEDEDEEDDKALTLTGRIVKRSTARILKRHLGEDGYREAKAKATQAAKRAEELVAQKEFSEEDAIAQAINEVFPAEPVAEAGGEVAKAEEPAAPEVAPEAAPAEPEVSDDKKLANTIADKAAELIEGGADPKDAVLKAIDAALADTAPEEPAETPPAEKAPEVPAA